MFRFIEKAFFVSAKYLVKSYYIEIHLHFLSITVSCKDLLCILSKNLFVCWFLSCCILYLFYFFMIISYITFLPIDNMHAVAVDFGIAINPIPVRDNVIKLDAVAMKTNVSNDFNIVVKVLYFLNFFFGLLFLILKYVIISLMLLIELLKLLTSFNFFSILCSKSLFSNGALGFNLSHFWSLYCIKT